MEKASITESEASHCLNYIKYHIVWLTRRRKPVLKGNTAKRAQAIVQMICRDNESEIIAGYVREDHIHLLAAVPPGLSVSELVQQLKKETSEKLQTEYNGLKKQYWGKRLWSKGAFIVSSENVKNECIAKYIKAGFKA